jgi:hypothetical protein
MRRGKKKKKSMKETKPNPKLFELLDEVWGCLLIVREGYMFQLSRVIVPCTGGKQCGCLAVVRDKDSIPSVRLDEGWLIDFPRNARRENMVYTFSSWWEDGASPLEQYPWLQALPVWSSAPSLQVYNLQVGTPHVAGSTKTPACDVFPQGSKLDVDFETLERILGRLINKSSFEKQTRRITERGKNAAKRGNIDILTNRVSCGMDYVMKI